MAFFKAVQQNLPTAVLFWFVFFISIMISRSYQKSRIQYNSEGNIIIGHKNLLVRVLWAILIIILPSLLIGFRNYDVGADTMNLVIGYSKLSYESTPIIIWDRILYSLLRYGSFIVSNGNPTFFLFSMCFLTLFILILALDKWLDKISMPLALFVYYALFGMQLLNQARQLMALSILFYGISYLVDRKYKRYIFFVILASLFHFTAFIGIFFLLFYFKRTYYFIIKKMLFYLVLLLSPFLIFLFLKIIKFIIPSSYRYYIDIAKYDGIGMGFLITIFPVITPIFLFRRYLRDYVSRYLSRIALLTFPLRFSGYYSYFLMRLNYYTSIFMVLIIPLITSNIEKKSKKKLAYFVIFIILMVYYVIHYMYLDAGNIFPYKSIFFSAF